MALIDHGIIIEGLIHFSVRAHSSNGHPRPSRNSKSLEDEKIDQKGKRKKRSLELIQKRLAPKQMRIRKHQKSNLLSIRE